jgi:N-acetylglucosamine-6-phosphate deacetylase
MTTKIINGRLILGDCIKEDALYVAQGKIQAIGGEHPYDRVLDAKGCYVSPGFIDIHCHGGGGYDFNMGTPEAASASVRAHLQHGTTSIYPTVTSSDIASMERAIEAIDEARKTLPSVQGIHLEGPYFSPAQMGAQNGKTLTGPIKEDYERILNKYHVTRWDYAPDTDPDFAFLDALLAHGVIPAAAHTDATCKQMEAAADRGCRLITHLYSCTSTIRREMGFRIAGVVEAAYLRDEIAVELIADGCHLPHELLRLAYKQKGVDRIALVTDAMCAAGAAESGEFELGGVKCVVEDGVAKLLDRSAFAGSIATADRLLRTVLAADISVEDGVRMLTETPARLAGLSRKGVIREGYDADIVIFNKEVALRAVFVKGERIV